MPKEIAASQYYIHRSYVPVYYYLYKALEKWISEQLFRNDDSRVFCASDDYAFRRRFELTDTSKNYKDIEVSSLRFPFSNYWPQNSGWQPDNRIAANPAPLIYTGIYEGYTKIRAAAGIINIPTTFYFDREDDARMAYEKLYFLTYNEHNYSTTGILAGETLGIPMIITVNNLRFNPNFKENDWLRQNRIFTVTVDLNLRSYIIYPPNQPNWDVTVDAEGEQSDGNIYDDGSVSYEPVNEVILNMKDYNNLTVDSITVKGTIEESGIELNMFDITNINTGSAIITWEINNLEIVDRMEIKVGNSEWFSVDPALGKYQISGLEADSKYSIYINIYSKDGKAKRFGREFVTKQGIKKASENSLVGISW